MCRKGTFGPLYMQYQFKKKYWVSELILGLSNFGHPTQFTQQDRSLKMSIKVRTLFDFKQKFPGCRSSTAVFRGYKLSVMQPRLGHAVVKSCRADRHEAILAGSGTAQSWSWSWSWSCLYWLIFFPLIFATYMRREFSDVKGVI